MCAKIIILVNFDIASSSQKVVPYFEGLFNYRSRYQWRFFHRKALLKLIHDVIWLSKLSLWALEPGGNSKEIRELFFFIQLMKLQKYLWKKTVFKLWKIKQEKPIFIARGSEVGTYINVISWDSYVFRSQSKSRNHVDRGKSKSLEACAYFHQNSLI